MKCQMETCQQPGEAEDLETLWRHSTDTHAQMSFIHARPFGDAWAITTHRQLLQLTHGRGSETFQACVDQPVMWSLEH